VTGVLVYDFTPSQSGLHSVHWSTTVPTTAEDDVFVAEAAASQLVSVDESVLHLRATGVVTSDADREQLQWLCIVATKAVEQDLDRIFVRRSVTEAYDGGKTGIKLRSGPIISITSVVENGVTLTANTDYVLDSNSGVLWRGTASAAGWWAYGRQLVTVTYVAGMTNPPAVVRLVALYLIQALWQSSQQASHPAFDEGNLENASVFAGGLLTGLPQPLRNAYESLQSSGTA